MKLSYLGFSEQNFQSRDKVPLLLNHLDHVHLVGESLACCHSGLLLDVFLTADQRRGHPGHEIVTAMRKLASLKILFIFARFLSDLAHSIEARHHVVVESVDVPRSHKPAKDPTKDPNEATKLGEEVEDCVARARVIHSIQVHLDGYLHPCVIFVLVGHVF